MDVDLAEALTWVNDAVIEAVGHPLKAPETVILKGTWRGLTYEQMAKESDYSTNYLMRDVAPKLWRQLSSVFGQVVGKTNFRVVLDTYSDAGNARAAYTSSDSPTATTKPAKAPDPLSARVSGALLGSSRLGAPTSLFYGYDAELSQIEQWLTGSSESCLVGIWGLPGVGKSLLCETAVARLNDRFDAVVRRSLKRKPLLTDFCDSILTTLGLAVQPNPQWIDSSSALPAPVQPALIQQALTQSASQSVEQLLRVMAQHSVLLIIEDVESILQPHTLAGDYQTEHQPYGEFFQAVVGSSSCIILTGTEGPTDWVNQTGHYNSQKSIYLTGLDDTSAKALLAHESLSTPETWSDLIRRYQGHPLALLSAARVIRELFNGRVDTFLQQTPVLLTDIVRLLTPSFERLSEPELTILYWLASQKASLSLADIQQMLPPPIGSTELISALDSLRQRFYLTIQSEVTPPTFQLPPLIKAHAIHRLMAQFKEKTNPSASDASSTRSLFTMPSTQQVINLSSPAPRSIQLDRWFQGDFEPAWQPLSQLFETATLPSTRLRNTYHLRDETFIKRYKSVSLGMVYKNAQAGQGAEHGNVPVAKVVLVVAVRRRAEEQYEVCVQVQPRRGADTLPADLELRLLDAQHRSLAAVQAVQADSFIQLPYFQGQSKESFSIEMLLGDSSHAEEFLI
ncbi:MAG: DUF1822 family protein [Cyanobacteria bacterium J06627_28]